MLFSIFDYWIKKNCYWLYPAIFRILNAGQINVGYLLPLQDFWARIKSMVNFSCHFELLSSGKIIVKFFLLQFFKHITSEKSILHSSWYSQTSWFRKAQFDFYLPLPSFLTWKKSTSIKDSEFRNSNFEFSWRFQVYELMKNPFWIDELIPLVEFLPATISKFPTLEKNQNWIFPEILKFLSTRKINVEILLQFSSLSSGKINVEFLFPFSSFWMGLSKGERFRLKYRGSVSPLQVLWNGECQLMCACSLG